MTEAKHAPGPWRAFGKSIRAVDHQRHYTVARVHNPLFTNEANEANARLIAASPCMAREIESAIRRLDWFLDANPDHLDSTLNVIRQDLRAVYAKATTGSAA